MRAVLCKEWGDPSTLVFEEVGSPEPEAGEVSISVRAAGVNFADNLMVEGQYQFKPDRPFSPGFEVSGTVSEVGPGIESVQPGTRVMAALPYGGYAEQVVVPEINVQRIPDSMSYAAAAAFPVAYSTVHLALTHRVRLGEGQVLLVHGASGDVGRAAVEIGKRLGAYVIAVGGSSESLNIASERGADQTIDYAGEDIRERVLEITDGRGADVVLDPVGGDAFDASLRCVAWEGTILVVGFASGRIPEAPAWRVLLRNCAVTGIDWGGYLRREPEKVRSSLSEALRWYEEGALRPEPSETLPMEQAAQVLKARAARELTGKVVLVTEQ